MPTLRDLKLAVTAADADKAARDGVVVDLAARLDAAKADQRTANLSDTASRGAYAHAVIGAGGLVLDLDDPARPVLIRPTDDGADVVATPLATLDTTLPDPVTADPTPAPAPADAPAP